MMESSISAAAAKVEVGRFTVSLAIPTASPALSHGSDQRCLCFSMASSTSATSAPAAVTPVPSTSAMTASSATPPAVSVVPIDAVASQVIQRLLEAAAGASMGPNSGNLRQSESRMLFRLALWFSLSVLNGGA